MAGGPAGGKGLAPGLYLVATPIGNLEDISLRALCVLREADVIACEDTRQTQKLLQHFDISAPKISYHQHNEAGRAEQLLQRLRRGERIALVSDSGTPGISDPGAAVVSAAIAGGLPVFPVPGACAFVAALVASGLNTESFVFFGFLPSRSGERRSFLESLASEKQTMVFYDSPHRIGETLADVEKAFDPQRKIVLARELTKLHEEFLRGPIHEVRAEVARRDGLRGEIVLLVAGAEPQAAHAVSNSLGDRMRELMSNQGLAEKDALKRVAKERQLSKSEAYREWQRHK